MDKAKGTNHFNINETVFVSSDTSDEGTGYAYGNFEIDENNGKNSKFQKKKFQTVIIKIKASI